MPPPLTPKDSIDKELFTYPFSFTKSLAVGCVSSVVAKSVFTPLERAQLYLKIQQYSKGQVSPKHKYKSFANCLRTLAQKQGVRSLWSGNAFNVIRTFPQHTLNFAFFNQYKTILKTGTSHEQPMRLLHANMATGGAAALTTQFLIYPIEQINTYQVLNFYKLSHAKTHRNFKRCVNHIVETNGIKGLYHGFSVATQSVIINRSVYFGGYYTAKAMLLNNPQHCNFLAAWLIGFYTTTAAGVVAYPFEKIYKTMLIERTTTNQMYQHAGQYWGKLLRTEGITGCFKGYSVNIPKNASGALVLALYDEIMKYVVTQER